MKKIPLSDGLTVRPALWTDLDAVLALSNAVDVAVYGAPDTDLEDLRDSWQGLDLAKDSWVVENESGDVVGYAAVFPDAEEITLDFFTRPGIGLPDLSNYLLVMCLRRAHAIRARGAGYPLRAVTIIPHVSSSDRALLEKSGFRPRKYYLQMHIELQPPPEPITWPAEFTLRTFEPGDEVLVYEFIQNAFQRPGYRRPTFNQWREFMIGSGRFDPELWSLLVDGQNLIGAVLCFDYGDLGWIRQVAVAPDRRGRGLGSALLQHAFNIFHKKGRSRVALGVSTDNPMAVSLYRRIGMKVLRQYDEYYIELAV